MGPPHRRRGHGGRAPESHRGGDDGHAGPSGAAARQRRRMVDRHGRGALSVFRRAVRSVPGGDAGCRLPGGGRSAVGSRRLVVRGPPRRHLDRDARRAWRGARALGASARSHPRVSSGGRTARVQRPGGLRRGSRRHALDRVSRGRPGEADRRRLRARRRPGRPHEPRERPVLRQPRAALARDTPGRRPARRRSLRAAVAPDALRPPCRCRPRDGVVHSRGSARRHLRRRRARRRPVRGRGTRIVFSAAIR